MNVPRRVAWAASRLGLVLVLVVAAGCSSGPEPSPGPVSSTSATDGTDGAPPTSGATEAPGVPPPTAEIPPPVTCPAGGTQVKDANGLRRALRGAAPGTVIRLADGVYSGTFTADLPGTAQRPVWICGGPGAVLDAGDVTTGYVLHLDGADHYRLVGFAVRNGQKGVMVDNSSRVVIQGLTVTRIGDEGIHLRRNSSDNVVAGNTVSQTGLRKPKFGEGIYVGSSESNWCDLTECRPDRSDRNVVARNRISDTTAESIDVKEGTVDGRLLANTLDGGGATGETDSVVDVKGNGWLIAGNVVTQAPHDGFQTHELADGWGSANRFEANVVHSVRREGGYVVAATPALANVIACTNTGPQGMQQSKPACR